VDSCCARENRHRSAGGSSGKKVKTIAADAGQQRLKSVW
jgi:hypothetical protein